MTPLGRLIHQNTTGNLWIYILILAKKGSIYGYTLRKEIKEKFGFLPGKISAYRVLYRLEKEGYLTSEIKERKRTYFLTKKGQAELEKAKEFYKKVLSYF